MVGEMKKAKKVGIGEMEVKHLTVYVQYNHVHFESYE